MHLNNILVALDFPGASNLLRVASDLAHKTGAELKALYVEDVAWFEASQFSFTQQISGFKGELVPFTEEHVSKQSQALSARFKKIFSNYSESLQIKFTYQSTRGSLQAELLKVASTVDLAIIRRRGGIVERGSKLGNAARNLVLESTTPVLLWNDSTEWPKVVIGICTSVEDSKKVAQWTLNLGGAIKRNVRLFWTDTIDITEEWAQAVVPNKEVKAVQDLIVNISEPHPFISPADLKYYRNCLFVMQRKEIGEISDKFFNTIPNSVLLL
jgi:nucleotide-binding universal stress UspA family protein